MKTFSILFTFLFFANLSFAQTHVSKDFEPRNALLEEFTGIHCGYCPQGHQIAKNLLSAQADKVYVLAIHTGNFSVPGSDQPDFRSDYGPLLYKQSGEIGFPSGTINREVMQMDISAMSRSEWAFYSRKITKDTAKVNLWMSCSLDEATRVATIEIEGYWTKELGQNYALLNLALTENNIKGPQSGAGMGEDYLHQHMLRDLITGQWGDTLLAPKAGEYFTKTYTYTIPDSIKKVEVKLQDLEFVTFVTLDTMHVLNVTGQKIIVKTITKPLTAIISAPKIAKTYAYNYFTVNLDNFSSSILTSAEFLITTGSKKQTCTWQGSIDPFSNSKIEIPCEDYSVEKSQTYSIELKGLNGQAYTGNKLQGVFQSPTECTQKIYIEFRTDICGADNTIYIKDRNGNVLKEAGPFPDNIATLYKDSIEFTTPGVYAFEIKDTWANGLMNGGYYKLFNSDKKTIFASNEYISDFGDITFFNTIKTVSNESILEKTPLTLNAFPNPATENTQLKIVCGESGSARISIFDIQGKEVYTTSINVRANTSYTQTIDELKSGFYFVKLTQNKEFKTLKLIIK